MISLLNRTLLAVLLAGGAALPAAAAEEAEPWPLWEAHFEGGSKIVHKDWDAILGKYVVEVDDHRMFAYGRVSDADKALIRKYINYLSGLPIEQYSRDEQLAYWLNLHNALVIDLILREYPVESVQDIGGWFWAPGPWKSAIAIVKGEKLSLNDIMHRILRPIWGLGVHYGLNHGAKGSPDLHPAAYTGETVNEMLSANMKRFVDHPRGVSIGDGNRLTTSEIYDWYKDDFSSTGDVKHIISHYKLVASRSRSIQLDSAFGIDDYQFDWSLNEAK